MSEQLYAKIVDVVEAYLGPAAQRFVDRQITSHLDKPPQEVTTEDLQQLTEWIKISMSLMTDNRRFVDECVHKLTQLT